jgi:RNA polymerase sigma-70 factor (ECF subfamily)
LIDNDDLKAWFCEEVLPLEPALMRFIRRHWRVAEDVVDIRQDVYARVLEAASRALPANAAGYVFTTAKNALINRARRASVISIDVVADIQEVAADGDWLTPERHVAGREALRRLARGMDMLPPRCREIIRLRKVEGLSTREVANCLGIGVDAVQQQTMLGMRALTDFMLGGDGRIRRPIKKSRSAGSDRA